MRETSLAQSLAVESQIRLPGSAGRLLKQIRDIEAVAPLFRDAGLIKVVERPATINMTVGGVATHSCIKKALGGFIYASAGVLTEMIIDQNKISTKGSDSVAELDDIDFEAQRKRLDLVEMRQAYTLVERALKKADCPKLILIDTPLFIAREMIPLKRNAKHWAEYENTSKAISQFWAHNRLKLFPWDPDGPVLVSILAQRFSAIVSIARQDLRTDEGRKHLLMTDGFDPKRAEKLTDLEERLGGVGDQRFIKGILGAFTRTIAFRMTENRARMEPSEAVEGGVVGFHFKGGRSSDIQMAQLAGEEGDWNAKTLDTVAWQLMILDMQNQKKGSPLPQLLGQQQLKMLEQFTAYYRQGLDAAMKNNEVEDTWLSGLYEEKQ
jgi:hypothetical protein